MYAEAIILGSPERLQGIPMQFIDFSVIYRFSIHKKRPASWQACFMIDGIYRTNPSLHGYHFGGCAMMMDVLVKSHLRSFLCGKDNPFPGKYKISASVIPLAA